MHKKFLASLDAPRRLGAKASFTTNSATHLLIVSALLQALSSSALASPQLIAMTDQVRSMCEQAEQMINSGRAGDAIKLLNQADSIDPSCAEVHGYLGMAYQNSGKTAQAIPEYTKALQLNPQMSFINVNLGTCLMNMNQLDQALPYFQRYLQENPNAKDAAQVNGYIQQAGSRKGQLNLRGLFEQGQSLLNQHKYNEARSAFEQAIAQQPNFAPAHFYLCYTLAQSGQNQPAIGEFQKALQLDPNMKEATLNIGSNYQSLGDCANAISWYERYLSDNPGSQKSGDVRQRIKGLREQLSKQGGASPQAVGNGNGMPQQGYSQSMQLRSSMPVQQDDYLASAASGGRYFRWTHMPIKVCIASGAGTPGFRDSYFKMLMDSFSMWAQGAENRLAFLQVGDPSQADIICRWTGDSNQVFEAGRPIEGGLTKLSGQPQQNGDVSITNAQVILLTNRSGSPLSDDDMKKVCLHEVGHALGINGHSNNNADIMFFSESPTVWPALTKRDKATICKLYGNYARIGAAM